MYEGLNHALPFAKTVVPGGYSSSLVGNSMPIKRLYIVFDQSHELKRRGQIEPMAQIMNTIALYIVVATSSDPINANNINSNIDNINRRAVYFCYRINWI